MRQPHTSISQTITSDLEGTKQARKEFINASNNIIRNDFVTWITEFSTKIKSFGCEAIERELSHLDSDRKSNILNSFDIFANKNRGKAVSICCGPDTPSKEFTKTKESICPKTVPRQQSSYYSGNEKIAKAYCDIKTDYENKLIAILYEMVASMREMTFEKEQFLMREYSDISNYDTVSEYLDQHIVHIETLKLPDSLFDNMEENKRFMRTLKFRLYEYMKANNLPEPVVPEQPSFTVARCASNTTFYNGSLPSPSSLCLSVENNVPLDSKTIKNLSEIYHDDDEHSLVHVEHGLIDPMKTGKGKRTKTVGGIVADDLLVLSRVHKSGLDKIYRDQYGIYWVMKGIRKNTQIKQIAKDVEFLDVFGVKDKFVLPLACKVYTYRKHTEQHITKRVLLYKIGYRHMMKKMNVKKFEKNDKDSLKALCGSITLMINALGYRSSILKITSEGKFICSAMDGNRCVDGVGIAGPAEEEYLHSKGCDYSYKAAILNIFKSCNFKRDYRSADQAVVFATNDAPLGMTMNMSRLTGAAHDYVVPEHLLTVDVIGVEGCVIGTVNKPKYKMYETYPSLKPVHKPKHDTSDEKKKCFRTHTMYDLLHHESIDDSKLMVQLNPDIYDYRICPRMAKEYAKANGMERVPKSQYQVYLETVQKDITTCNEYAKKLDKHSYANAVICLEQSRERIRYHVQCLNEHKKNQDMIKQQQHNTAAKALNDTVSFTYAVIGQIYNYVKYTSVNATMPNNQYVQQYVQQYSG